MDQDQVGYVFVSDGLGDKVQRRPDNQSVNVDPKVKQTENLESNSDIGVQESKLDRRKCDPDNIAVILSSKNVEDRDEEDAKEQEEQEEWGGGGGGKKRTAEATITVQQIQHVIAAQPPVDTSLLKFCEFVHLEIETLRDLGYDVFQDLIDLEPQFYDQLLNAELELKTGFACKARRMLLAAHKDNAPRMLEENEQKKVVELESQLAAEKALVRSIRNDLKAIQLEAQGKLMPVQKKLVELEDQLAEEKALVISIKEELKVQLETQAKAYSVPGVKQTAIKLESLDDEHRDIYSYPVQQLSLEQKSRAIVVMLVGASGSGKSTLINSMVNYLTGVPWNAHFRYKLIYGEQGDQSNSMTQVVKSYAVLPKNCRPIIFVDTPGFGDTRGPARDETIMREIGNYFKKEVDTVHAILFVANAGNPRLSPVQKYIFDRVLSLFGQDAEKSIGLALTFSDAKDPPIINAIEKAGFPFKFWYKFNNSATYAESGEEMNELFHKMNVTNLGKMFDDLTRMQPFSLVLSREVLNERNTLGDTIVHLRREVDTTIAKAHSLKQVMIELETRETQLDAFSDFWITVTEPKIEKVNLPAGRHTTTCLTCNRTCHENCAFADDTEKEHCCAMNSSGHCTRCPGKCIWSLHKNVPYILKYTLQRKQKRSEELYDKYVSSHNRTDASIQIFEGQVREYEDLRNQTLINISVIIKSLQKLNEIALLPNTHDKISEYIDMLMKTENLEKRVGYSDRIAHYQEMLQQQEIIPKIIEHGEDIIPKLDIPRIMADLKERRKHSKSKTEHRSGIVKKMKSYVEVVLVSVTSGFYNATRASTS